MARQPMLQPLRGDLCEIGAHSGNRTRDLSLTKGVLCH